MCAALNRLPGVELELATTDANGADAPIAPETVPAGFVTHLFSKTFSERWKFSAGLWTWLRQHTRNYDLVHIHSVWSFATLAAGAAAARAGVPDIVRPAGMLSTYTLNRRSRSQTALLARLLANAARSDEAAAFPCDQPGRSSRVPASSSRRQNGGDSQWSGC